MQYNSSHDLNMQGGLLNQEFVEALDRLINGTPEDTIWESLQTLSDAIVYRYTTRPVDGFEAKLSMDRGQVNVSMAEVPSVAAGERVVALVTDIHPPEPAMRALSVDKACTLLSLVEAQSR